jgi:broad specificity phosphatase PhoE
MKHIYFVRHGETQANVEQYVASPDEPLNDTGRRQAAELAARTAHLQFEKIIASPFARAQETAQAIASVKDQSIETCDLFREFMEPSSFYGTKESTAIVEDYIRNRNANVENIDWRQEDGETLPDVFKRTLEAKQFLETCEAESILVVSHAMFLRFLLATILMNPGQATSGWHQLCMSLKKSNCGISFLTEDAGKWKLFTWNDHAHFAE